MAFRVINILHLHHNMSITLQNLSKFYGSQQVLKNLNLSVKPGEIVGFLGPNGAGKTTTMRLLAGVLHYGTGSARICDLEVNEHPMEIKKLIGYLPENNPLYPDMYVKEYLNFVTELYKLKQNKKKRVDDVIDMVGLRPESNKKIGQLSKGYRQRIGIAQTLIHDPQVLILDEPTTGLDPNQLIEIRSLIKEVGKDRAVLFSTHIMQEVEAVCSRVAIINKGEIVADFADVNRISQSNSGEFSLEVRFTSPVASMGNKHILSASTTDNLHFTLTCDKDIRSEIFDFAVETNNKIVTLRILDRKMEELFRELTAEQ